jgi:hypothetical protein
VGADLGDPFRWSVVLDDDQRPPPEPASEADERAAAEPAGEKEP